MRVAWMMGSFGTGELYWLGRGADAACAARAAQILVRGADAVAMSCF
jgi:hypothetical protein